MHSRSRLDGFLESCQLALPRFARRLLSRSFAQPSFDLVVEMGFLAMASEVG